ncbi:MAG TPA: hypothetical protein VGJ84_11210 [Polyangiaceae bacterium]
MQTTCEQESVLLLAHTGQQAPGGVTSPTPGGQIGWAQTVLAQLQTGQHCPGGVVTTPSGQ